MVVEDFGPNSSRERVGYKGRSPHESPARKLRIGLADQRDEGVIIDGLDQVVVEARLSGAEAILVLAVAGDGDDHDIPESVAAKLACDLIAVHAGQADVEEDEFRPEVEGFGDGGRPVISGANVIAQELEQLGQ